MPTRYFVESSSKLRFGGETIDEIVSKIDFKHKDFESLYAFKKRGN